MSLADGSAWEKEHTQPEAERKLLESGNHPSQTQVTFYPTTLRGADFMEFAAQVLDHIENYTVPQYGDKGEDQASEFKSHDHIVQAKKYLNRYGKNSRPGQEILDLVKTAHYCQMAAMELEKEMGAIEEQERRDRANASR